MSTLRIPPCAGCRRPLIVFPCTNPMCEYGPDEHSGYTLPPDPRPTTQPDPFREICEKCGQAVPKTKPAG